MPKLNDRETIKAAVAYRSGNDSCNSFYMGGLAQASMCEILGGVYGGAIGLNDLINRADRASIARALAYCEPYIKEMKAHPRKKCPTCGGIIAA